MTDTPHPALDDIARDLPEGPAGEDEEESGVTIVEYVRDDTAVRWVAYQAPVLVKVTVNETGHCEVGPVILACDPRGPGAGARLPWPLPGL